MVYNIKYNINNDVTRKVLTSLDSRASSSDLGRNSRRFRDWFGRIHLSLGRGGLLARQPTTNNQQPTANTLPYPTLPYLTFHLTFYLTFYLTLPFTLPYLTLPFFTLYSTLVY